MAGDGSAALGVLGRREAASVAGCTLGDLMGAVSSKLEEALKVTRKVARSVAEPVDEKKPLFDASGL